MSEPCDCTGLRCYGEPMPAHRCRAKRVIALAGLLPYSYSTLKPAIDEALAAGVTFEQARQVILETHRAMGNGLDGLYAVLRLRRADARA